MRFIVITNICFIRIIFLTFKTFSVLVIVLVGCSTNTTIIAFALYGNIVQLTYHS